MTKTQFMFMGILVLFGSFAGGALVTYVFDAGEVQAVILDDDDAAVGRGTYSMTTSHLGYAYVLNTTTGEITNVYVGLNKHAL